MNNQDQSTSNIIVLIDRFTKDTVGSITYDTLSKHAVVITDIREIGDEHFRGHVVIFEPCVSAIVTPEILQEVISKFEVTVHLVYQHSEVVAPIINLVSAIKADYSDLSWNFVYAVVNEDLAILEPYQRSVKILDGFSAFKQRIPADMQEYMDRFRGSYLDLVARTGDIIAEISHLRTVAQAQEAIGRQTIAGLVELKGLLDRSQDKVNAYEALLSKEYAKVFAGFYPERPRVLYIKKISHISGVDTLLSVLFAVLTKQYRSSCKVIKLVDSGNALDMRYIPNTYVAVTDPYNTAELFSNDFLMKLGAYSVMFDTLMLNRSGLEYLIIHDMRGTMSTALDSTLIDLRLNEISSDYAVLGEYDNVLSDQGRFVTFPWSFKECQKYTGSNVVKLANHPTIAAILDLLI